MTELTQTTDPNTPNSPNSPNSPNTPKPDTQKREVLSDEKWHDSLAATPQSRKILEYMKHVEGMLNHGHLGVECPADQCITFRKMIIRALETSETPFGLPKKLPKFIAMMNLCGERMLCFTEDDHLFRGFGHSTKPRMNSWAASNMLHLIKYQREHPECSLLLTYASPFQVDMENLWWDVRALTRDPETLKVTDGMMAYQSTQDQPRPHEPTQSIYNDVALLDSQINAYAAAVRAFDLDILQRLDNVDDGGGSGGSGGSDAHQVTQLKMMALNLITRETTLREEHKKQLDKERQGFEAEKLAAVQAVEGEVAKTYSQDLEKRMEELHNKAREEMSNTLCALEEKEKLLKLRDAVWKKDKSMLDDLKRKLCEKDKEILDLKKKVSVSATREQTIETQAQAQLQAQLSALREEYDRDYERKKQQAIMRERQSAEAKAEEEAKKTQDTIQQLTLQIDRMTECENGDINDLKSQIRGCRFREFVYRLGSIRSANELQKLKAKVEKAMCDASKEKEVNTLETVPEEVSSPTLSPTPSPSPELRSEVKWRQTHMTVEEETKLLSLQTEYVTLNDQYEALKHEHEQLKQELGNQDASMETTAATESVANLGNFVNSAQVPNPAAPMAQQSPTDAQHSQKSVVVGQGNSQDVEGEYPSNEFRDENLECVIQSGLTAFRQLIDTARNSVVNRQLKERLQTEVQIMKEQYHLHSMGSMQMQSMQPIQSIPPITQLPQMQGMQQIPMQQMQMQQHPMQQMQMQQIPMQPMQPMQSAPHSNRASRPKPRHANAQFAGHSAPQFFMQH